MSANLPSGSAEEGRSEAEIAARTQRPRPSRPTWARPWTRDHVHQLLTNEKYIGNNVYNRTSFKLKKKRVQNPPEMWVYSFNHLARWQDATRSYPGSEPILNAVRQRLIEHIRNPFIADRYTGHYLICSAGPRSPQNAWHDYHRLRLRRH